MRHEIEQYLEARSDRFSPNTTRVYGEDLAQARSLFEALGITSWGDVREEHVLQYITSMREDHKYSENTVVRRMRALRGLFGYLVEQGAIETHPMADITDPARPRSTAKTLSETEVAALLDAVRRVHSRYPLRDVALLWLLYGVGMRPIEVRELNMSDLSPDYQSLHCRGYRDRTIHLPPQVSAALKAYVTKERKDEGFVPLLLGKSGYRVTESTICRILRRCADVCGIREAPSPRMLRDSYIVHMRNAGATEADIQRLIGFRDKKSTRAYTRGET